MPNDAQKLVESLERGFSEYMNYLRDEIMRLQRVVVELEKRVQILEKPSRSTGPGKN